MNYYIECRNIFDRSDLEVYNNDFEVIGNIHYNKPTETYNITSFDMINQEMFKCKSNPLRLKPRFVLFNNEDQQVARVKLGVKIIHSIIESDKYYFVKAAFWKIKYQVYDNRAVVATLDIVRKDKKRYFHITSKNNDYLTVFCLFLLAQAVRMKVLLN